MLAKKGPAIRSRESARSGSARAACLDGPISSGVVPGGRVLGALFLAEVVIESLCTSHYPQWVADHRMAGDCKGAERMRRFAFMEAQIATLLM